MSIPAVRKSLLQSVALLLSTALLHSSAAPALAQTVTSSVVQTAAGAVPTPVIAVSPSQNLLATAQGSVDLTTLGLPASRIPSVTRKIGAASVLQNADAAELPIAASVPAGKAVIPAASAGVLAAPVKTPSSAAPVLKESADAAQADAPAPRGEKASTIQRLRELSRTRADALVYDNMGAPEAAEPDAVPVRTKEARNAGLLARRSDPASEGAARHAAITDWYGVPVHNGFRSSVPKVSVLRSLHHAFKSWRGENAVRYPLTSSEHWTLTALSYAVSVALWTAFLLFNPIYTLIGGVDMAAMLFFGLLFAALSGSSLAADHIKEALDAQRVTLRALRYKELQQPRWEAGLLAMAGEFELETGWRIVWTDSPYLLAQADPANKRVFMSIGWILRGGDPLDQRRYPYLHVTLKNLKSGIQ
ncbi:MAG: hypothetical protein WC969_00495 [Elusimicrobiota bacterium]|jgi:hypothetical protein